MIINGDVLDMCRLVAFVEQEKQYAVAPNLNVEGYAQEVLKRFQVLYPDAVLKIGSYAGEEFITKNYVCCGIDGTWEFYLSKNAMSVKVKTNGTINLDEGTAETIFTYVNDR